MPSSRKPGPTGMVPILVEELPVLPVGNIYAFANAHPIGLVATPPKGGRKHRRKGTREITVVSDFPNPWRNLGEERRAIEDGLWFPSTDDFIAVAKNSGQGKGATEIVDSIEAFVFLILQQPEGSIRRINILTHGAPDSIAFSGEIDEHGAVFFENEMDIATARLLLQNGLIFKGKRLDWDAVDARFAADAQIVFYACKAALDKSYLQDIANVFAVRVRGFSKELSYRHTWQVGSTGFNRRNVTLEGKKDFHDIDTDVQVAFPLKDPF